jgi:hypothetical protein
MVTPALSRTIGCSSASVSAPAAQAARHTHTRIVGAASRLLVRTAGSRTSQVMTSHLSRGKTGLTVPSFRLVVLLSRCPNVPGSGACLKDEFLIPKPMLRRAWLTNSAAVRAPPLNRAALLCGSWRTVNRISSSIPLMSSLFPTTGQAKSSLRSLRMSTGFGSLNGP